jgi:diaminohydroxyphosphoribosylaminopyrimidine deaminase/5-amino-6-(5-phosphoribosylamino)uracil reductase
MDYMERALSLARGALGTTSPNPSVGAVIVRDGNVVSEGWTQPPGQAHAEIMAIRQAGPLAKGATLYVTLEPCNHYGRTPPCAEAIIEAGIAEVHAATTDPNPRVKGGGLTRLNEAGIRTHLGEREQEARQLIEAFAKYITTGTPFVTAKFAMSLDGRIATRTGDSRWITGEESRRYVHELRAQSDAILAGINTVLADDPQLTARDEQGKPLQRQPLRVVVDSRGRMPPNARMLSEPGKTLVAVAQEGTGQRLKDECAEMQHLPSSSGAVDLSALLRLLGQREITSVFVEGGGTLLGSLFDAKLVDKVVAFVAPVIIGGVEAPSPVAGVGVERMAGALRLCSVEVRRFGDDLAVIGYCKG